MLEEINRILAAQEAARMLRIAQMKQAKKKARKALVNLAMVA